MRDSLLLPISINGGALGQLLEQTDYNHLDLTLGQ